jgi:3-oxoacyl-[acyl-carrier-protein] synthase-3
VQSAASLDALLGKPSGWLEQHAGIRQRRVWGEQDPLEAATAAGLECLERAGLLIEDIGVLLVTSESPPVLAGLGAALHHRLGLRPETTTLEVGGACTGFLSAMWLGQRLLPDAGGVLILSLESASRCLSVRPGPEGEFAALFGDATAAVVLCRDASTPNPIPLRDVRLGVDGSVASLLQVLPAPDGVRVRMDGTALATAAVRTMADAVAEMTRRHGLSVHELHAIVAHGGNGRLPGLLARRLGLREERVWSETPRTGNLGSASLPAAWAMRGPVADGPVIWVAVGAGLTWSAALTG